MTLISIDQHQMTHWLPPEVHFGRFAVPADMVAPALNAQPCRCGDDWGPGCKCHTLWPGRKVNDFDPLPPWGHFRKEALKVAAEFRHRMAQQSLGFMAVTPEADMVVMGPYHHKPAQDASAIRVLGRQGDENLFPEMLDFKIWCEFTQKYARALDEGPGRPKWALDYWAKVDQDIRERETQAAKSGLILATR